MIVTISYSNNNVFYKLLTKDHNCHIGMNYFTEDKDYWFIIVPLNKLLFWIFMEKFDFISTVNFNIGDKITFELNTYKTKSINVTSIQTIDDFVRSLNKKLLNNLFQLDNPELLFRFLHEVSNDTLLEIVKKNGLLLKFVKEEDQTEEICLAAINENTDALRYVFHQTRDICIKSIETNPYSIKHIINQKHDYCVLAISLIPLSIKHIRNITFELLLFAVKINKFVLYFVHLNDNIIDELIQYDETLIQYIKQI